MSISSDLAVVNDTCRQDWKVIGAGGFGGVFKPRNLQWRSNVANKLCIDDGCKQQNVVGACPADYATYSSRTPSIIHPEPKPGNAIDICLNVKTRFSPSVSTEHATNEYRFQFPGAGLFQCNETGLAFKTTREGEVIYRTVQWEERWLQTTGRTPAGPLFDIQCPQNSVCQLHLPHCTITPGDDLSVAHISGEKMDLLEPQKVTETHVVVNVTHFSLFGLIWSLIRHFVYPTSTRAQVLLLLQKRLRGQVLYVFLLSHNVPRKEVITMLEAIHGKSRNVVIIPGSCLLTPDQHYTLHCSSSTPHVVQPKRSTFFVNYGPNYHPDFMVSLDEHTDNYVSLKLLDSKSEAVWAANIQLEENPSKNPPETLEKTSIKPLEDHPGSRPTAAETLRSVRSEFIGRVSDPVIDRLVDKLVQESVINDVEMEEVHAEKSRAERARTLIDMVRWKGNEAPLKMITALGQLDPELLHLLGLDKP